MRTSWFVEWLMMAGIAAAIPGIRRRQAQTSANVCTCPANGFVTTTVVESSIVTSFTTVTTQSGTVFSTGPTQVVTVSSASTTTLITGTTTIIRPGVTQTTTEPSTTISTITAATAQTTCIASVTRKVKRQNTDSASTLSTETSIVASSDPSVFTSTISSRGLKCLCRIRPQSTTLAGTSTCSCPEATMTTITVSSVATGTTTVTVTTAIPTVVVVTPSQTSTITEQDIVTVSDLETVESTESPLTLTSQSVATVYTTFTPTIISCPTSTPTPGEFVCNATAYLVETTDSIPTLYNIDLETGSTFIFATNVGGGTYTNINGMGYNPLDNYLYAIGTLTTANNYAVIRISTSGSVNQILRFTSSSVPGTVGEVDSDGQFWFSGGGTNWYQVDLAPGSSTFGTIIDSGTSTLGNYAVFDWAYLPGRGNYLWSIGRSTDSSPNLALLRWSQTAHTWSVIQEYTSVSAPYSIIANWGGNNGTLWGQASTSGSITRLALGGQPVALSVNSHGATNGDGARCVLSS